MARKRVLLTGAAGYLSRQLLPVFRERVFADDIARFVTSNGRTAA